jgi:tRNA-splicing ligase RtcB (3'-phosphate/5'-hydroxy nucleic acid ligase)
VLKYDGTGEALMERLAEKLFSWASILDELTRNQAHKTALMPFIFPHVALMPDAHLGKGATVGSVIPTEGAIIPAAVGVDIGCGMIAVRTQWTRGELRGPLSGLREAIEKVIPLSAGNYNKQVHASYTRRRIADLEATDGIESARGIKGTWYLELGTLGSGNHFIEVSVDEADRVWAFLHSGSRGIGNKLANQHIKTAKALSEGRHVKLPDPDLAYLAEDTAEFENYIRDLRWAQKFALLNRAEMMDRVLDCLADFMGAPVSSREVINCHHNYTEREQHFGRQVWLSRKGAIDAHAGVRGLIPGSMGTRSYVVTGKGNKLALCSSPHGAGREYSRSAARKAFSMAELEAAMQGIEWRRTKAFLDEIPAAYKPIDVVMEDAKDLVAADHELRQLVNVKGD